MPKAAKRSPFCGVLAGACLLTAALAPTRADAELRLSLDSSAAAGGGGSQAPAEAADPEGDAPTRLPDIEVSPSVESLNDLRIDRNLRRLQDQLPGLGTEGPRIRTLPEKITDALGLSGDGVQALHPADQERLADFNDQLHGTRN